MVVQAETEARAFAGATVPTGTAPAWQTWAEVVVREPEAAGITLGLQAQHDVVELARLA